MAKPASLICGKREFKVSMGAVILLELFNGDPRLLARPYFVNSNVSVRVFETFVDAITGKNIDVTLNNYAELDLLSKEFGFHGLDEEIVEAKKESEAVKHVWLLNRLRRIETTLELIQGDNRALYSLEPRVATLERDIASLSTDVTAQITAERNARLVSVKDLNATVQVQGAQLDRVVAAKLDELSAQISDERKSRQSDIQDLKAMFRQPQTPLAPQPSVCPQAPEVTLAPTSGARREFKLAGDKFNGVIAHFTRMSGGNAADKGLVHATGSSADFSNRPTNALDLDNSDDYYMSDGHDPWFCLDFKARKVSVTHYSLCSAFLRSWVLEGSHDGSAWDQLDKRDNNNDMKTKPCEASFTVANRCEYRFIRLTQTGKCRWSTDNLSLFKIEFFGTLIE